MADDPSSYIVEFINVGRQVKVSAVDPETGVEVSIVGPADAGRELLTRNAVRKLEYVLSKQESGRR